MNWQQLLSPERAGQKAGSHTHSRSAFEQDYDRIIFSHPFRRLQDKTQVHPLPEHDFVHTRLTHSLEVSSVGRSLGKKVGEEILRRWPALATGAQPLLAADFGAVVAAASLAHDLGNPPFGHSGEEAISDFFRYHPYGLSFQSQVSEEAWADLTRFEGNAQGFRILNKQQYQGLRLTHATLGAFTKYPCPAHFPARNKARRSQKKFGFFLSELPLFASIATQMGLPADGLAWRRHPLAFLVEAADDICYSIIDLEDGCRLGLVSMSDTVELLVAIVGDAFNLEKFNRIASRDEKIGVLRAMAIGKLVDECAQLFLDHEQDLLDGTYDIALTDRCPGKDALGRIVDVSVRQIYRARHVVEIETAGFEVLPGLLDAFCQAGEVVLGKSLPRKYHNLARMLPEGMAEEIKLSGDHYAMLRLVIDFVSGLTDKHAISLYRKIKGIQV
ncbi:MAG: dNTP triphosphohydrolase [Cyclobacteriaceae bacterium]|nr:dNTP triphosphohydrolase [Cyclobacteriaceae bacterium]